MRRPPNPSNHLTPSDSGSAATVDVETHIARLEEQLGVLKAQVRQAQQLAGLGTAAAMIAHEVSNLLSPVIAYAQYTIANFDEDLARKALERTLSNGRILMRMMERFHEVGSAKVGKAETFSVRDVADRAVESLCRPPSKDGITLSIEVDPSLTAWADPLQIQQVLFNLLHNARRAMNGTHNGRITISAQPEGNVIAIAVRDTGPGIDPEILPHLFDMFASTKSSKSGSEARCTGLGLALCRDLIEENGGTIEVESGARRGATFTLRLPAPA
ncbi:MAG: HAMP domain-containing histidine kinase [Phycisphaerae bacterium]|nr:HAMP domain-containing histidine kinase [Phycisphaerae bacterium]